MPGIETWSVRAPGGDFDFDERGHLVLDDTVATAIVCALEHELDTWWANPDHGSRIPTIVRGTPEPDQTAALESAARQALAPLERAQRIRDLRVTVALEQNRARITVDAHDIARARPIALEVYRP